MKRDDGDTLAAQVNEAQSILGTAAADEAARIEWAQAALCEHVAAAMAARDASSGAGAYVSRAGTAIFAGAGSSLTQAMAMGLRGPVDGAALDAIESHLRQGTKTAGNGPRQLEVCAFADPSLSALLAERRYRVSEWQLVWTRAVPDEPPPPSPPDLQIRRVAPGEEERFFRVVMAGFLESETVPDEAIALMLPTAFAENHELYLAWLGDEAIGGAALSHHDGVAFVNGSGVRPAFRRRGAQGALIRARLARARTLGCTLAVSNTLPGTASRRNMERHGFSVAYPKLVFLAD
jgi:GNAT superfamily N-acetyltransferase